MIQKAYAWLVFLGAWCIGIGLVLSSYAGYLDIVNNVKG